MQKIKKTLIIFSLLLFFGCSDEFKPIQEKSSPQKLKNRELYNAVYSYLPPENLKIIEGIETGTEELSGNNINIWFHRDTVIPITEQQKEVIKQLIEEGANMYDPDIMKQAIEQGNKDIIKCLIECGYDINKNAILVYASSNRSGSKTEIIKFLLENGADPNKQDLLGQTPLDKTTEFFLYPKHERWLKNIEILLKNGANFDKNLKIALEREKEWGKKGVSHRPRKINRKIITLFEKYTKKHNF